MIITDKDGDVIKVEKYLGQDTRVLVRGADACVGRAVVLTRDQVQELRDELNRILEAPEPGERAYQVFCANAKDGLRRVAWRYMGDKAVWAAVEAEDYS